jgi:DNA-binding response OmpR family regulator
VQRELTGAGYAIVHAADGVTGLELCARENPDLVILDWMLPKLDGLEVLRQIRRTSAVSVLMLTARGEETDRVIGLEVG